MAAPDIVRQLVERFEENRDSYRSGKYNETQLRHEFLDPFFKALGWDINNEQGYAEAYKDVINEDSLEVEGATKAPDYAFRIGGMRKFFIEAKKPAVNIEYDTHPAFQLRRYAWSAKLPLSILTDFEEFAVYESRSKPDKSDSAATGRVMLLNYKDYLTKWDEIAAIFSREAVLKGSFDQYAEVIKGKKGTTEVDDAFLQEIEHWRDLLAHIIALRNPDLQVRELNYAVQMTIDRIVFLRICEDRGIEREDQLQEILKSEHVYERLCQLFRQADNRYNSGLFHFAEEKGQFSSPDDLTLRLTIDDKVLKEIISGLYYPSPYVFKEIPADILGQVYERFLGKVIRLTSGHQAKVEEKPEVRKAGGVYYTPTYIVNYIVKNTVGKLLEGKTPREVTSLKILDPACGSGSFLLGAFQYLLDWHIKWYSEHEPETWAKGKAPAIYQAQGGDWRLTTAEKKRILLDNLHGVDIDPQAVEVTKLSLSLKVLEGENQETIGAQLGLFKERALPDLGSNIKCGNSLIGPDYYEGRQLTMFIDDEERYRVNAFNWQTAFPQIFVAGGFDVVIGNPPYIPIFDLDKTLLEHFARNYRFYEKRYDSYAIFIERVLELLNSKGYVGYIIPSSLLNNAAFAKLRSHLVENVVVTDLRVLGGKVFANVNKDTMTIILRKGNDSNYPITIAFFDADQEGWGEKKSGFEIKNSELLVNGEFALTDPQQRQLLESVFVRSNKEDLCLICNTYQGIVTGSDAVFILNTAQVSEFNDIEKKYLRSFLFGGDIGRYLDVQAPQKIIYLTRNDNLKDKPNFEKRIGRDREKLSARRESKQGKIPWYALHWPRDHHIFEQPKILVQGIRNLTLHRRVIGTLDLSNSYAGVNLSIITLKPGSLYNLRYVLGILNSNLINYLFRYRFVDHRIKNVYLDLVPIRKINFSDSAEKAAHDKMVSLVERMLELHRRSARTPQEKEMIRREIESTDRGIDSLVYELYGLTDKEIKIVDGK